MNFNAEERAGSRFHKNRLILAIMGILLVIGLLCLRFLPGKGLEREIEAIRLAGLPTSPGELNQWYPQVPASNNAALLVIEAAKVHGRELSSSSIRLPAPGEPPSAELARALEGYLKDNQPALQKLHAATKLSESRFPIDITMGASLLLPHLAEVKGLAQLLRYEGIFHSSRGHRENAFDSVTAGFSLAQTLRDEPLLISALVRIACVAIAAENLEYLISRHQLTRAQLTTLSSLVSQAEADGKRAAFRALAGERAGTIPYFTMSGSQLQNALGPGAPSMFKGFVFDAQSVLGFRDRDLRLYLELIAKFSGALTNPLPRAYQLSKEADAEMDLRLSRGMGKLAIITRMVLPAISKFVGKEAAIATHLRAARTALAIELFRLDHPKTLPAALTVLVPEYLPELQRDAVHDEPLQYVLQTETGYEISSPRAAATLQNAKGTKFSVPR